MSKKIGAMQPYLFPYLGYFQLIEAVDVFVLNVDAQYIQKGWINRNMILVNGKKKYIQFPLSKASYLSRINERVFADNFPDEARKISRQIWNAYLKAPFFKDVFPLLEDIIFFPEKNLSRYAANSIRAICDYLHISTPILATTELSLPAELRRQDKVIEIVKKLDGAVYINPIGGVDLYNFDDFRRHGITLKFHRINDVRYRQFENEFVSFLSIIDVLMFNSVSEVRRLLSEYSLEDDFTSRDGVQSARHALHVNELTQLAYGGRYEESQIHP